MAFAALVSPAHRAPFSSFEGGDHYLSDQEHRLEFFMAMGGFRKNI
jgi:hypothetical protein